MLTPNMTPRGSLQLSYLIVGKFLVSQAFQQGAKWPLPIFDHIDLWPSIWPPRGRFSDLKIFPFDFCLKVGLMYRISLKYHRPAVSHCRAAMSFMAIICVEYSRWGVLFPFKLEKIVEITGCVKYNAAGVLHWRNAFSLEKTCDGIWNIGVLHLKCDLQSDVGRQLHLYPILLFSQEYILCLRLRAGFVPFRFYKSKILHHWF
jgi:hypothetical protein